MSGYKSLYQRLLAEGYTPEWSIKDEQLPEDLVALALDLSRRKYERVKIVPTYLAVQGEEPKDLKLAERESSHLLYVVLSEAEAKRRNEEGSATIVSVLWEYQPTGEKLPIPLTRRLR